MIQTKKVTLNPGEFQEVAFSYTPKEARTYYVTIDGLAGSFKAVAAVPVLSYFNMKLLTPRIPGEAEYYVEVSCDIKNVGGGGTREVSLWLMSPKWDSGLWRQITYPSFLGWDFWAIPPGTWNAGTITLTLAPGETFHFHYAGVSAAYGSYTYAQLRDDAGGASEIVRKYAG